MRELILKMSMSVDGFIGGPNGEIDWMARSRDAAGAAWVAERISRAGAHLLGRKSFQSMASYWPTASGPLAAPMNEIPKIVFSRKGLGPSAPAPASAGSWAQARVLTGELAREIAALKSEPGKDLVAHGGTGFAQSLVQAGLVDEYWLVVHPVALGRGFSLFAGLEGALHLKQLSATPFESGAVAYVYRNA